ncbi:hypothetical protein IV203_009055 [Nitzschia inconspicua]|uniref:Uncharacterized protein n=1 Tax=Nitzschia inconspicua TaxID=303405 RepID=A0A9K3PMM5_9STRA|nr:hypothetical protein IV203_009055 [Nitzschia inconspicua]
MKERRQGLGHALMLKQRELEREKIKSWNLNQSVQQSIFRILEDSNNLSTFKEGSINSATNEPVWCNRNTSNVRRKKQQHELDPPPRQSFSTEDVNMLSQNKELPMQLGKNATVTPQKRREVECEAPKGCGQRHKDRLESIRLKLERSDQKTPRGCRIKDEGDTNEGVTKGTLHPSNETIEGTKSTPYHRDAMIYQSKPIPSHNQENESFKERNDKLQKNQNARRKTLSRDTMFKHASEKDICSHQATTLSSCGNLKTINSDKNMDFSRCIATEPFQSRIERSSCEDTMIEIRQQLMESSFEGEKTHSGFLKQKNDDPSSKDRIIHSDARNQTRQMPQSQAVSINTSPDNCEDSPINHHDTSCDRCQSGAKPISGHSLDLENKDLLMEEEINSEGENEESMLYFTLCVPSESCQTLDEDNRAGSMDTYENCSSQKGSESQLDFKQLLLNLAALNVSKHHDVTPSSQQSETTSIAFLNCNVTHDKMFLDRSSVGRGDLDSNLDRIDRECRAQKQALQEHFNLDETDLDFILDHIAAAQNCEADIRWDLIEALVFPEDLEHHESVMREIPVIQDDSTYRDAISIREHYQEMILDLLELHEESQASLQPEELHRRQQTLIHLLRATSDEEAHLTSLSLDDVSEIVAHIQLCFEQDLEIQWSMLHFIVFPLGILMEDKEP